MLDTPGFDDTHRSDTAVLRDLSFWLAEVYNKKVRLAGIIYLHRIIDVRMQGSALRNLRLLKELCGADNLKSVILATTHWTDKDGNHLPESVGQARMKELEDTEEFWGGMIERGSRVERHDGSRSSARKLMSDLLDRQDPVELAIQKQLVDEKRILFDTDAGQELRREVNEARMMAEDTLAELKLDMDMALLEKDKRWQEQITENRNNFEAKIQRGYQETESLKIDLQRMVSEKDKQFQEMVQRLTSERIAWERKYREATSNSSLLSPERDHYRSDQERMAAAHQQQIELFEKRQANAMRREYGAPFRM